MTHDTHDVDYIEKFFYWQTSIHLRVLIIRQIAHKFGLAPAEFCTGVARIVQYNRGLPNAYIGVSFFTDDQGDWTRMAAPPSYDTLTFPQSLLMDSDEVVAAHFQRIKAEADDAEKIREQERLASWRHSRRQLYEQLKTEFEES